MKRSSVVIFGGVLLLVAVAGVAVMIIPSGDEPVANAPPVSEQSEEADSPVIGGKRFGKDMVGGVLRPDVDLPDADQIGDQDAEGEQELRGSFDYGSTPVIARDANPRVVELVKAIDRREEAPEVYHAKVSALARIERFDARRFRSDSGYRQKYVKAVEPARAFESAEPGPDVPRLTRIGPPLLNVVQGEAVRFKLRSAPGMPVSLTSFDLGLFSSQTTAITVVADEQGIASVEFFAPPGTIEDVNILASSPVASGQVKYVVNVTLPE